MKKLLLIVAIMHIIGLSIYGQSHSYIDITIIDGNKSLDYFDALDILNLVNNNTTVIEVYSEKNNSIFNTNDYNNILSKDIFPNNYREDIIIKRQILSGESTVSDSL